MQRPNVLQETWVRRESDLLRRRFEHEAEARPVVAAGVADTPLPLSDLGSAHARRRLPELGVQLVQADGHVVLGPAAMEASLPQPRVADVAGDAAPLPHRCAH